MNPYAHYPLIQLHQAELRREAEHHRLAAAARRGPSWWARFIPGPVARTTRPAAPTVLRPAPQPTRATIDRAA